MNEADPSSLVPDLSNLESDLAKSLQPSWATKQSSPDEMERMAGRFGHEDVAPRRDGGKGRRSFSGRSSKSGPKPVHPGNKREGRRTHSSKERVPQGGSTRFSERPRETHKPATIPGWELRFLPDPRGMDGIAKQIKTTAKSYALFDLARLVLERPERFLLSFKKYAPEPQRLWLLSTDGSIWKSRREAEDHALSTHPGKFFRIEEIHGEPPKGNYSFVAQCSLSGEILGPPNHHEYLANLKALHSSRFQRLPFETYKQKVRMLRDEESVQRWKDSKSRHLQFFPLEGEQKAVAAPTGGSETTTGEADGEEPADGNQNPSSPQEEPTPPKALTAEEAKLYFQSHFSQDVIKELPDGAIVPGAVASSLSAGLVTAAVNAARMQLNRFPFPLAQEIGRQLQSRGLHIFKSSKKILHISVARPKPLLGEESSLAEGVRRILQAVRSHPHANRNDQWKAILAHSPETKDKSEEEAKNALAADFAWLLREGHIIDYASGGLVIPESHGPPMKKPE